MPDQSRTADYEAEKAVLDARKQKDIREAQAEHAQAVARIYSAFNERMTAALARWDAVKSQPEHPHHDAAMVDLDRLRATQADPKPANDALALAIHQIETEHAVELAELGRKHGVQNNAPVPGSGHGSGQQLKLWRPRATHSRILHRCVAIQTAQFRCESGPTAPMRMAVMTDRMRSAVNTLGRDQSGATAIEYALIISFISITVVGWATFVGTAVSGFFVSMANGL